MNIMAFVGSPRKNGNTDILVEHFLDGARSKGAETEKVYLYDCNIKFCQGCYKNCWINPNDCTRHRDDMDDLIPKMIQSDLVLFASPVYMGSYSAQLTAFFERCIPVHHVDLENNVMVNNRFKGTNAVIALVHDSPDPATAQIPFMAFERVLNLFQMNTLGKIHVSGVRDQGDIKKKEDQLKETYQLAVKLCSK